MIATCTSHVWQHSTFGMPAHQDRFVFLRFGLDRPIKFGLINGSQSRDLASGNPTPLAQATITVRSNHKIRAPRLGSMTW
ncbi:hypothetical protein SLA2020_251100 [Shorea laevis]